MKSWIKLLAGLVLMFVFVKTTPILLNKISAYREFTQRAQDMDIDTAALFYSDEYHTSTAERTIKESLHSRFKKLN